MERFDVIVIGGGPAGLMAAGRAAEAGRKVLLIEKNAGLGEKLLLAGKRRCNLTNALQDQDVFLSRYGARGGEFLRHVFSAFGPRETIAFFNRSGVRTVIERGSRVFPEKSETQDDELGGSQRVLECLLLYCKKGGVRFLRKTSVKALKLTGRGGPECRVDRIITNAEELSAERYIVATGGKSYPKTGSTGDGYRFACQAGHRIVKPTPALVPVRTKETWIKLANRFNLRNVKLSAAVNGELVDERFGEMEFTNFGLSGAIVMELSSFVTDWMERGETTFIIDMKPALSQEKLVARIERDFEKFSDREFGRALVDLAPSAVIPMILELSDVPPEKPVQYVSPEEKEDLAFLLKNITLTLNGLWSFDHAIVTKGGVELTEVDPKTMRSNLCENLYFAGEVLDINGPTGGFNLQNCWSTGAVSGSAV
ncbi:aminoacetone oxidase family FAD-binding enzyme [Synergistales bacterium]|nr:aminoacetone oxidase family FAD-binding enzyme [Synergistales bacterium]